jgi:hypothetical protein
MAERVHTYTKQEFNGALLKQEITNSVIIPGLKSLDAIGTQLTLTFKADLSDTEKAILDKLVADHCPSNAKPQDHVVDHQNKIFVHQSSRPLDTTVFYTGNDDEGQMLSFIYRNGRFVNNADKLDITQNEDETKDIKAIAYYNYMPAKNITYLHEAIVQWENCRADMVTCSICTEATPIVPGSYTDWVIDPASGVIVPSPTKHGNIELTGDPVLVEMVPDQDTGIRFPGYWMAEPKEDGTGMDPATMEFCPDGDGFFNMFGGRFELAKFVRKVPLLGTTSSWNILPSSDTARIGAGMLIKMELEINSHAHGDDEQDATVCISFIMHREHVR